MEHAILIKVTLPTAKWYVRVSLFFTYWRRLPKWVDSNVMAEKYLNMVDNKPPSGHYIDIKKLTKGINR